MESSYYDRFRIHSGTFWDVYVSERGGNNLGRIYFWLKRNGIIDFHELTDDELMELRRLEQAFNQAIRKLFNPDGPMNFAYLANGKSHDHHCHYHLVPRYQEPRQFDSLTFTDPTPGKQWSSGPLDDATAIKVGQTIMAAVQLP